MTSPTTTLIPAANLKYGDIDQMQPGTVFFAPSGGGIGLVVHAGDQLRVLALKDMEADKAKAGDIFFPTNEEGLAVENAGLEIELDWRNDLAPFQRPTKDDGPAALLSPGGPLILGVYGRGSATERGWVGFGLDGKRKNTSGKGAIAPMWNLVLTFNDRRVPISVG
jgi:hypothetical protein